VGLGREDAHHVISLQAGDDAGRVGLAEPLLEVVEVLRPLDRFPVRLVGREQVLPEVVEVVRQADDQVVRFQLINEGLDGLAGSGLGSAEVGGNRDRVLIPFDALLVRRGALVSNDVRVDE
jgi:hypothetical protein